MRLTSLHTLLRRSARNGLGRPHEGRDRPPRLFCGYAPYPIKICLNGHEWAKRQLQRRRLPFTALDNGFLSCARPNSLQAICDALEATAIERFFARWQQQIPFPLTADHVTRGFTYQLSTLQAEVSLTQVFDRTLRGREFIETVIRENLDLGRPDHVQLLFPRQIRRTTPGRFTTHVITKGVNPSLHIAYKHCRIKQYFRRSARCAPRPPSTIPTTSASEGGCRT